MLCPLVKIKNNFFLSLMFVLSISLVVFPICYASFGVNVGDWAKYEVSTSVSEGSQELVDELSDVDIDWLRLEVENVSSGSVIIELTAHFINGTEETDSIDSDELGFIVEADLQEGDSIIAPYLEQELTIDSTLSREYVGSNRFVNLIEVSSGLGLNNTYMAFFDQETGILCEMSLSLEIDMLGEHYESSLNYKLIETNVFDTSILDQEWIFRAIILGALGTGLIIVIFYLRSKQIKKNNLNL
ncbi:MAG: hypothetical protein P8X91_08510 [Candidatus Bathyarchaeota archaeon]